MKRRIDLEERPAVPIRRHEGGYAAEGPGFYIWDEDLGEVFRAARQLAAGVPRVTPTRRFLVIPEARRGNSPE